MALTGHLDIACSAGSNGRSFISRQSFCAPFHISKPYWDDHALLVQIANPTAGVFAGDTLSSRVAVGAGARLLLTTPSANRIHTMPSGRASVAQHFSVESGGWLEVMPELFIPQAHCRYRQRTEIELAQGGEMFFVETLAPGRVARGEVFEFDEIEWAIDVRVNDRLVARERFALSPHDKSLAALRRHFPQAYYASCYIVSDRLPAEHEVWRAVHALADTEVTIGAGRLADAGSSVRILAADSIALARALRSVRRLLAPHLTALQCAPRKL